MHMYCWTFLVIINATCMTHTKTGFGWLRATKQCQREAKIHTGTWRSKVTCAPLPDPSAFSFKRKICGQILFDQAAYYGMVLPPAFCSLWSTLPCLSQWKHLFLVALEIVEEMEEFLLNIKQRRAAHKNTSPIWKVCSVRSNVEIDTNPSGNWLTWLGLQLLYSWQQVWSLRYFFYRVGAYH